MVADRSGGELLLLVADSNLEFAVKGLMSRPQALGIRPVVFEVLRHPERDPGCLLRSPEFLRSFRTRFDHALVLFDHEGCGREQDPPGKLEEDLEQRLGEDWDRRARVVVLQPELEIWVWSDSPHVEELLGWRGRPVDPQDLSLRSWLEVEGFLEPGAAKPERPKEAVEHVLRAARQPRSSALYRKLAEKVSFRRCSDRSFQRFQDLLQAWFPPSG